MPTLTPATQCPHCGYWIFTRLYYRTHVQECVYRTFAMKDLSDDSLEVFPVSIKSTCTYVGCPNFYSNDPCTCGDITELTESHDPFQPNPALYQQSDRVNIIRESELMTLIEQSDTE